MRLFLVLLLSFIRIPLALYLYFTLSTGDLLRALMISIIAGVSDKLDGTLARKLGTDKNPLGRALDPISDRVFIIIALFAFMIGLFREIDLMRIIIFILLIQEFLLIPIAVYLFLRRKIIISSYLGKVATFYQYVFIVMAILYGLSYIDKIWIIFGGILMFFLSIASGVHHLLSWLALLKDLRRGGKMT